MAGPPRVGDVLSLSVHGPVGVLDLHVPAGASSDDLAREYSRQANLPAALDLYTRLGKPLEPDASLADAGLVSGAVVVALDERAAAPSGRRQRAGETMRGSLAPGALSTLWCVMAAVGALLAAVSALGLPDSSDQRTATVWLLFAAAGAGVLPLGPLSVHRVLAVPAFAGAATLVLVWDAAPERLPTVIGFAALGSAVAAAVARALDRPGEEGLRVWIVTGSALFAATTLAALVDVPSRVVWAVVLLAAMLSARFVPMLAVDVPDQYLLDIERLAVTAWSARERPSGRRGRIVVPMAAVSEVAARGTRMITAASGAVLGVSALAAVALLAEEGKRIDDIGARVEVGLAAAALLLAARSFRHAAARALLRAAGLVCGLALLVALVGHVGEGAVTALAGTALGLGVLLVAVAVALGRGWRSAWWSRRAEVAESMAGAFAVGSVVVASGLFTALWEIAS